jgi:multidrug resistance efflux pump
MLSLFKKVLTWQKILLLALGALVVTGAAANGKFRLFDSERQPWFHLVRQSLAVHSISADIAGVQNDYPTSIEQDVPIRQFEGNLVPVETIKLGFNASAQVTEVFVKAGDMVAEGEVLARLGNRKRLVAEEAAADYELLEAHHALDQLNQNAALDLAQAEVDLAGAELDQSLAKAKVRHLKTPPSKLEVDQAYANMLLAEHKLQKTKDDLRRAEKKFANKKDIMWYFVGRHEYKLLLDKLNRDVAQAALRYDRATEKYDDLIEPVDEVDLALAEAELAMADARVAQAKRTCAAHLNGPDPDDLSAAQARIQTAEARLIAARAALRDAELVAPVSGKVVDVKVKTGQWTMAGNTAVVLADTSRWIVETQDLTEMEVTDVSSGQPVKVIVKALPELKLRGSVESISLHPTEKGGDVFYTVKIHLDKTDPRLRWGMTVDTIFDPLTD